jgi:hypothetical protein
MEGGMPAIPDEALDCVVYLYPDAESALNGERAGGCGFIVAVDYQKPGEAFAYVVTNSHVIREGNSPVVRVNTRNGGMQVIEKTDEYWIHHPDGDDVAVLSINFEYETIKVKSISDEFFATKEKIEYHRVGPGDEVFMPGRFINHEGKQRNLPAVRFGNISMLPHEPIRTARGLLQEAFLVECRSLPGYSGSPVFLLPAPFSPVSRVMPPPMLLGIVRGHIKDHRPVLSRESLWKGAKVPVNPDWVVETNTGMAFVIPAWKIRELLYMEDLVQIRREIEEQLKTGRE